MPSFPSQWQDFPRYDNDLDQHRVGLGAKVLVGGENGTISLQPIALQEDEGFNIAAGVTSVSLHPAQ